MNNQSKKPSAEDGSPESKLWLPAKPVGRRNLLLGAGATAFLAACGSDAATTASGDAATAVPTAAAAGDAATAVPAAQVTTAPVATTAPTAVASAVKTGGTLRVGLVGSTNDIIDGQFIVTKADQARLVSGWEPLVHYDDNFEIVNTHGLAEEIETKAADLYVIRIKEGIEFHNGKTMTADDVVYSFQRRIDTSLGLAPSLVSLLDPSGITKIDDRTVQLQLNQPAVTFLSGLAEYAATIVPVGYTREDAEQVGTGPFMLQSFTPGAESVHVRHPNYWGPDLPYLDEVQIIDFADSNALVNALQSGDVDAIVDLPFSQIGSLDGNSDLTVLESQAGSWLVMTMAIDQAPFDDVRVRQAMRLLVDRPQMVERVLAGHGRVANDMYGVFDAAYPDDFPQREQDIGAAMALLEEAGQAGLEIDLFAPDDTAGLAEMCAAFAQQAEEGGVKINVQVLDGGTYWGEEYTKRTFATSFWSTRPYLNQVAAGSLPDATYPETHWPAEGSNFIDLYNQALAEADDAKRTEIIREMQRQEYEEGGNIIPFFNSLIDAHATYVHGFVSKPNILNLDHYGRGFKTIWLDT